jgi:hypothetical protein
LFDTDGVNVCSAITDEVIGIIAKGGDDTDLQTEVCLFGECLAQADGTVTKGKKLTPHADGGVVDSAGASCEEFALALESGVDGDVVSIFVLGSAKTHA